LNSWLPSTALAVSASHISRAIFRTSRWWGAPINEVAHKYCFSAVMSERTLHLRVSELHQQSTQRVGVAVHVANYVIVLL
jgi:hypothetical protein